jgi:hypothetical protein
MLAKHGYLPKNPINISFLYVLHVNLALLTDAHGAQRGRKVALFKNWIKQNRVMQYQLIKLYQLNQA